MLQSPFKYELIPSPMHLNGLIQQQIGPGEGRDYDTRLYEGRELEVKALGQGGRGQTRTATTLLDKNVPHEEAARCKWSYAEIKRREEELRKADVVSDKLSSCELLTGSEVTANQVSVYCGPLHNNRAMSASNASIADRLANARMMSKSGYTWDQNAACAKIRLGDGAILQNLYPSHSHVKLRSGKVERIDTYTQRFLQDHKLLREVTLIKEYEYNQWARTKPFTEKDVSYDGKTIPIERIESRYTQPSWDTLRTLNPSTTLSTKHKIFSYEDLVAKFSQPKFLKRLGYINDVSEIASRKALTAREAEELDQPQVATPMVGNKKVSGERKADSNGEAEAEVNSADGEEMREDGDEADEVLLSDDEEYTNDMDEALVTSVVLRPERIPSSRRSARQTLAIYSNNDRSVIGSRSPCGKVNEDKPDASVVLDADEAKLKMGKTTPVVNNVSERRPATVSNELEADRLLCMNQAKSIRRMKSYKLNLPHVADSEKKFVPFSQPVCLCPKLSKETLNSFYSSHVMQHYYSMNNGKIRCKLHGSKSSERDRTILKSL